MACNVFSSTALSSSSCNSATSCAIWLRVLLLPATDNADNAKQTTFNLMAEVFLASWHLFRIPSMHACDKRIYHH